jgi:hypothetical protein
MKGAEEIQIDTSHPPSSSFALRSLTTPSQRCWYEEVVRYQRMVVGGRRIYNEIDRINIKWEVGI